MFTPKMHTKHGIACKEKVIVILLTEKWLFSVPFMRIACLQECFSILNTANLQAIKAIGRSDISLKLEMIKKPFLIIFIIIGMQFNALTVALSIAIYAIVALLINTSPNKQLFNYGGLEQLKDVSISFIIAFLTAIATCLVDSFISDIYLSLTVQTVFFIILYLLLNYTFKTEAFNLAIKTIKEIG